MSVVVDSEYPPNEPHFRKVTMRERLAAHSWEAFIAFLCCVSAVGRMATLIFQKDVDSAVIESYAEVGTWIIWVYVLTLLVGGLFILFGIARARMEFHFSGLCFLVGALVVHGGALIVVVGAQSIITTLAVYSGAILASFARMRMLLEGRHQMIVKSDAARMNRLHP